MLDFNKRESKQIGHDYEQLELNSAILAGKLVKKILDMLRNNHQLNRDVKINLKSNQPANIIINIDNKVAYKGKQGEDPEINNLTAEQVNYLAKVIEIPEGKSARNSKQNLNRDVSIKVNNQEVYRLRSGVVELNKLNPELERKINLSVITGDVRQKTSPVAGEDKIAMKVIPVEVIESPETSAKKQPPTKTENLVKEETAKHNISQINEDKYDRQENPSLENIYPQENWMNNLINSLKQTPRKIGEAFKNAQNQLFVGGNGDTQKELNNLAVARTAKRILNYFGSESSEKYQTFEGSLYRIEQDGANLTITAKDGRGVILNINQGKLSSELSASDVSRFREIDQELDRDIIAEKTSSPSKDQEVEKSGWELE